MIIEHDRVLKVLLKGVMKVILIKAKVCVEDMEIARTMGMRMMGVPLLWLAFEAPTNHIGHIT